MLRSESGTTATPRPAATSPTIVASIGDMKKIDAQFTLKSFMDGAKGAFEMAFSAFLKDDRDTLKMLLAPGLFDVFAAELELFGITRQLGDVVRRHVA